MIVIPGYNGAAMLPKTIGELPPDSADEILLVDDGSRDDTVAVGRALGLTVISHPRNRGYGAAQRTGYREAMRRDFDIVVLLHGDDQYDPAFVPHFVARIRDEGYDVVTGTRMVLGDARRRGMPLWKIVPNRVLNELVNLVFLTCM